MARRSRARSRRGSTAIVVMFSMVVIIGMAALAIDAGHLYKVRTELQNVADATSLAAAQHLDGTQDGIDEAVTEISDFSSANNPAFASIQEVTDDDDHVEFGLWDRTDGTWTPYDTDAEGFSPASVNGVRIIARRDSDLDTTNVVTPFGDFLDPGTAGAAVNSSAIAISWIDEDACAFPLTVGDCQVAEVLEGGCGTCFIAHDATSDTFGFTPLDTEGSHVDAATLIRHACFSDPDTADSPSVDEDTRECTGGCNGASTDDVVKVANGNDLLNPNDQISNPCELIERLLQREGADEDGASYFTVTIPAFETDECPNVQYSGDDNVLTDHVTLDIWGVQCGNNSPRIVDDDHPHAGDPTACDAPSGKVLLVSLNCDGEPQNPDEDFPNATGEDVRLVR